MSNLVRTSSLLAATMTTRLAAGLLLTFAHTVMPGLGTTDDRTFVGAFQAIDTAIDNLWTAVTFIGAPVSLLVAVGAHLGQGGRGVLPWVLLALAGYVATVAISFAVNVPVNHMIQRAGPPDQAADVRGVRQRFEARWKRWNVVRTCTAVGAHGALCWALLAYAVA